MSESKTNKNNTVHVVGYLKENNLEIVKFKNKNGVEEEAVRGSIIIAVSELSTHKIQFNVNKLTKEGNDNPNYASIVELLPEKTISIASYLKTNPTANFSVASNAASKVYAIARFEEFASRVGEREKSAVTLKGYRAGFKQATDTGVFRPCADFTVDVYISKLDKEFDADGKETGRVLLEGIIPNNVAHNNVAYKISFVAYPEDNIAKYVFDNYHVTDTVTLKGDVVNAMVKGIQKKTQTDTGFFGRGSEPQYETTFVRERKIMGGSQTPIKDGAEGSFTTAAVKEAMANRDIRMDANGAKKGGSASAPTVNSSVVAPFFEGAEF